MDRLQYRIPEAAEILGIKRTKLYELIKEGQLEVVKIGAASLIPADSLTALAQRLRRRPTGGGRLAELIDEHGRIDVDQIPQGTTLADLEAAKRHVAERKAAGAAA